MKNFGNREAKLGYMKPETFVEPVKAAFTLIELLVVIASMGILAALFLPGSCPSSRKSPADFLSEQ